MNKEGDPYVIEYNVRMGDPESEVVLPRIKTDFVEILKATAENRLTDMEIELDERTVTTVMLVSGGYPGSYEKGKEITGLDQVEGSVVFHAGTKSEDGKVLTRRGKGYCGQFLWQQHEGGPGKLLHECRKNRI